MMKLQFRVLYREFLFRMVDVELLSANAQGDISKLLGQFAALLIFLSTLFALACVGFGGSRLPPERLTIVAWNMEHFLIATTMLVVGLFAVLSWDSTFPDRRDILVLAPLPVRTRTMFLAKVAAAGTALRVTVAALNLCTGVAWPLAIVPANRGLLDMVLSLAFYRSFFAYWVTMLAASAFIFCSILGVQGLAACLLSRHRFLRLSAFLQMAAFCLLVCVYFLQPSLAIPRALSAPENQRLLACLPSYWFLGLFQQLNGSMHPAMTPLVRQAWMGLAIAAIATCTAFLLSYFRTLREIVEEPDIVPSSRGFRWLPRFGNSLQTAIAQFSIRTLLRSRQHRVMLAFYGGIGFAAVILFMRTSRVQEDLANQVNIAPLFSSLVMMCVWVIGTRVVFSMPLDLRSNWMFRTTDVRRSGEYLIAIRRSLFVIGLTPVLTISGALFLTMWVWRQALEHLVILGLWGMILAYLCLHGFHKIPFTCSYLPGKSHLHLAFLAGLGVLFLLLKAAVFESQILGHPTVYVKLVLVLAAAGVLARWRTVGGATPEQVIVQFEEMEDPAILGLGLNRDGVFPVVSRSR